MSILYAIIGWLHSRLDDNKYITGDYTESEGWVGSEDRIIFCNRPDPLDLTHGERQVELRRQIEEDVA